MIDWLKLYKSDDPKRTFENFCYCIADGLYNKKGDFTPVDDKGGGDGVEFYLILPNGDEWGWQAKFFYPDERLRSEKGRRKQIIKSLERACEIHPNLKKWFLCTPGDLNPKEQKWFKEILPKYIPDELELKLVHWGYTKFDKRLSEPRFVGIRNYFFGELEFSIDWFLKNYKKCVDPDKFKFEEELHTETDVDIFIKDILFENSLLLDIEEKIAEIEDIYIRYDTSLNNLKEIDIDQKILYELVNSADKIKKSLNLMINLIRRFKSGLSQNIEEIISIDFIKPYNYIKSCSDEYKKLLSDYNYLKNGYDGIADNLVNDLKEKNLGSVNEFTNKVYRYNEKINEITTAPLNITSNFINVLYFFIKRLEDSKNVDLHILGDAGVGKTHIANHICFNRLNNGFPALIISGRKFTTNLPVGEQLKQILDIPSKYSLENFLDSLETAAKVYNVRIPLIIDGLNESTYNNAFSSIWKNYLSGFVEEIKQRKHIVLITTCRKTYRNEIWGDNYPENVVFVSEFDEEYTLIAIKKYFKFYKINANLTYSPLKQFSYPLYLRIFCEITNPDRNKEVEIYIGETTLFEVFDEFIRLSNRRICDHLGIDLRANVLEASLKKIANYLWKNHQRSISHAELVKILDNKSRDEVKRSESKTFAIEDEGLLIYRDMGNGEEVVFFTYDLFGGYIIAKYLVDQEKLNLKNFINSEKTIKSLFSDDYNTLHPLYEDIKRCLAALVPIKRKEFLHNLSDNKEVIISSIQSLFEISPKDIDENSVNFVKKQFKELENRELLFNLFEYTLTYIEHPFNAMCFFELLKELEMNDRDVSWTEYLRENIHMFEKDLENFEKTCKDQKSFSEESNTRINLFAHYIVWFLTSTTHSFRDGATRALYWYGRTFPEDFFELVEKSFEINDPYVSERMVAAAYGVCMARQYDFKDNTFSEKILPIYGRKLYDLMFKENAHYATTHILKRDYARQIIEISLIHHPTILTEKEKERIKPPYKDGGIRNWGQSEDRDKGMYRDGNNPMDGIVHEDPVSLLGKGMDKYQKPPEYVKAKSNLWWRVYQLGYSLELFGEIDKEIKHWNRIIRNTDEGGWADFYGRKYVFIAVQELAGCRDDHGLLKSDWEMEYRRTSLVNIDPSFPTDIKKFKLVEDDFLGKNDISIIEWILEDYTPNLNKYLIIDEINDEKGPWVLLDGYIGQENVELNRDIYVFPRGFFVKSEDENDIVQRLKQQNLFGRWLPEIYEDHYVYAGEIPWCDTFPENEWEELSFEVGTELIKVPIKKRVVMRDNEPLSEVEERKLWNDLSDKVVVTPKEKYFDFNRDIDINIKIVTEFEQMNDFDSELDDSGNMIINRGNVSRIHDEFGSITSVRGTNPKKVLKSELEKQGLEMKIIEVEIEKERPKYQKFEVLSPIRENNWDIHNLPVIPLRSVTVPNKQISESLELCSQPQTFDLYDRNGNKASKYVHYGEKYRNNQHFTYLHKDLLDLFLSKNDYKFIWAIWGGKEFNSEEVDEIFKFRKEHEDQKPFQEIIAYDNLKNQNQILTKKSNSKLIKGQ